MNKQELATKIWATANELRKNIKAAEYKDYILGFMFYKYLSDKEVDFVRDNGGTIEDLKDTSEENISFFQDKLGYFISHDNLFSTWRTLGVKLGAQTVSGAIESFYKNLNEKYARCFYVYNKEVNKHSGVFDALDSGLSKLGENAGSRDKAVRDIVDLVAIIPPKSKDYDVLGYIYEYLIKQFSSEAKKDGAFYTPHELTQLMARIVVERLRNRESIKVYDPCLGTAGLLLNIGKEAGKYMDPNGIKYYGQELITETSNLAKMNLFMQDVPVQNMIIRNANTLEEDWPYFDENTEYSPLFVDAVVANPPYSAHWAPDTHKNDERFRSYGLAPSAKADYAFLLHCLYHIKPDGVMAIVLPHGVLFRGGSDGEIRKNLVNAHNIETIIGFPSNLFFSTGIAVIVMILSKNRASDDILFIDASKCFVKEKTQSVLRACDVQRIFDAVNARKDIPNFAHLASMEEIKRNDYNLNIPRYVSADKAPVPFDPYSVITGEISDTEIAQFVCEWGCFPHLREKIFTASSYGYKTFADVDIRSTVNADTDVIAYKQAHYAKTAKFRGRLINALVTNTTADVSETAMKAELLGEFGNDPLIDKYDVYQAFAERWGTIEADMLRIHEEGREVCRQTEDDIVTKKNAKTKQYEDTVAGQRGKVIPLDLVKACFFADDYEQMNELKNAADTAVEESTDLSGLDESTVEAITKEDDHSKIDSKKLKDAIKHGDCEPDEVEQMKRIQNAINNAKALNKQIKDLEKNLDVKAQAKLHALTDAEINNLLIKKWIDPITDAIAHAVDDTIDAFASDLEALKKKYSDPLASLTGTEQETDKSLLGLMSGLHGSEADNEALKLMMEELK